MDKYDKDINALKIIAEKFGEDSITFKEEISTKWLAGRGLFAFACDDNNSKLINSGCLTMIRNNIDSYVINKDRTINQELTNMVRKDKRIPESYEKIKMKHLPVFAEWQRKLDKEVR